MADALKSGCTQDDFVRAWTIKGAGTQRAWDWLRHSESFLRNSSESLKVLTQKTPLKEIKRAEAIKKEYYKSKEA